METTLNIWKTSRKAYLEYFEKYSIAQLNKIPEGFSNNLIWNIGHVVVAQQGLVYKSSGLPGYLSDDIAQLYKPGTRPTGQTSEAEVNELKGLLMSLVEQTESDLANAVFINFNARMTGIGFYMGSLQDAIEFNNYHEGLHLGAMLNIRKFV